MVRQLSCARVGVASLAVILAFGLALPSQAMAATPAPTPTTPTMDDYKAGDFTAAAAQLPAALVSALQRDLGSTGPEYLAEAKAAQDAVTVVAALKASGVDVAGSRIDGTTLTVNITSPSQVAAVEAVGAVADLKAPAKPDFSKHPFVATSDTYGGQAYIWQRTSDMTMYTRCSLGFNGFNNLGANQFVTAGHCTVDMDDISGGIEDFVQTEPGDDGTSEAIIGSPLAGSTAFGGGYDSGMVTVAPANVTSKPAVLTWGGGAGAPLATAALPVTGITAAIVGADLCKSGSTTGWSCGKVLAVDEELDVEGNTVNSIVTDACVESGDSGGAALIGQMAAGITSAAVELACSDPDFFSTFFPMRSSSTGKSVAEKYGTAWEPSISVSTPVVTRAKNQSGAGAATVTGTLANATADSTVAVYLDGSQSPFATVSAATGSWTVTPTGAAATGSHTYRAIATWGRYSHSAAASGNFSTYTPSEAFVIALYADVLHRTPDASEISGWSNALNTGVSPVQIAACFVNSSEYRLLRINSAYNTILGRAAEPTGADGWLHNMQRGIIQTDDVDRTFYTSAEFRTNSGGTDSSFVAALYTRLLHRTGSAEEVQGWVAVANAHGRKLVVDSFWNSPETARERVSIMYNDYLGRYPDAGGLEGWAALSIRAGDVSVRWGIVGSDEYRSRATARFGS